MKSILLALDDTPGSVSARTVALRLVARHDARLTAICILDRQFLTAPEPEPIGGAYYKYQAAVARIKHATDGCEATIAAFEAELQRYGVAGSAIQLDSIPLPAITHSADSHDLIVVGRDATFHGQAAARMDIVLEELLRCNPRPVLLTAPSDAEVDPVLIAFDGSVAAARSLQAFTLLHMAGSAGAHLVSVATSEEEARELAQRGARYLELYGIPVHPHAIASRADAADILLAETSSMNAGMLVMGAFGRHGWRDALFGTCKRRLFEESSSSLFVHY